MLAEQAAQNAAEVEEAYGGFAQRTSNSNLSSLPSFLPGSGSSHGSLKKKFDFFFGMKYRCRIRPGIMDRHRVAVLLSSSSGRY